MKTSKRKYERHSIDIPIVIKLGDVVCDKKEYLNDISVGGLSFKSNKHVKNGTIISIEIPLVKPVFHAKGKVVWCRKSDEFHMVGVKFIEIEDAFKLRMVEQICHIEKYKKEIYHEEGVVLSAEEAAIEWIRKYAKRFPKIRS